MSRRIEAIALVAGYRRGRRIKKVVAVDEVGVDTGELVAVIGPNGAGKSTLLRTLVGAQQPLAGTITLCGDRLDALDRRERARRIAVVLTDRVDAGLLSAGEIIALGRHPYTDWQGRMTDADREIAHRCAERLGVADLWEQPFAELSDGQRQRVLVARALAQQPAVLVLDEPTAFLDITGRAELTAALADLAHTDGLAVLVSTHDLDLAVGAADRLWLVNEGALTAGAPDALAADGSIAAAFHSDLVDISAMLRSPAALQRSPAPQAGHADALR